MTLCFDGLHHLHLGFDLPGEYGSIEHQEWRFDNKDTDDLAMFLYPRACALVAARKLAVEGVTTQEYLGQRIKDCQLRWEIEHGSTPGSGTTENERGKG